MTHSADPQQARAFRYGPPADGKRWDLTRRRLWSEQEHRAGRCPEGYLDCQYLPQNGANAYGNPS